jgi:PHD/YefM family antitoxin component YafN of YafNO toxin-antitoxin module
VPARDQPVHQPASDQPANVLTSAELKRRGIAAIEQALQHGPVHLLKRNRAAAVVLSEGHFRDLQRRAAQAPTPQHAALEWLLLQPPAAQPRSKTAIDAELTAERSW